MKLLCAEYNASGEVAYDVIGDNALLRNNDDFYIPVFAGELSCVPQVVLRVGKIGKHVSERFAGRYYDEVGVGVRFYADDFGRRLSGMGLPAVMAYGFDGAAAVSVLKKCDSGLRDVEYSFRVNELEVFRGKMNDLPILPEKLIAGMSEYCMLKIGDLVYCGNSFRQKELKIGDRLQMFLGEDCLLDFHIK